MPAKKKKDAAKSTKSKSKRSKSTKSKSKASRENKFLVIVESPAKSKTITKILGKNYKVLASMGHIIDLPASRMGIDFENNYTPEYTVIKGRKKYLTGLKKEAKAVETIYLAADPDREGEAICWHLKDQLGDKDVEVYRVSFDEITEKTVSEAFTKPRQIDMNLVNAQQARRVMDRIVGYSLSPLLWQKITRGLSAGRVQSVAVRLIIDRENEIRKFVKEEYWSLDALLKKKDYVDPNGVIPDIFKARLAKYKNEKIAVPNKEKADQIIKDLENEKFIVNDISRKKKKSYPRSPYTTSVMQQDAFNKVNFSANKTMKVAQTLYEGVELGSEGSVGLITYMRTDSVKISVDAQKEAQEFIKTNYGDNYCPENPPQYKSKKRAQEAHEAIRPTLPLRAPKDVRQFLNDDEFKLYDLVWKRFISSQMVNALYSVLAIHIDAGEYMFKAGGGQLVFDGFLRVYEQSAANEDDITKIPPLEEGEEVDLKEFLPEQHFTKPPPRYTDASLVKMLEEKGIGRPSTYAPIIATVVARNYIKRMGKSLQPTELGELVNTLLVDNFPEIVDEEFTARLENELDGIEEGQINWVTVINDFYGPFKKDLEEAKTKMSSYKKQVVETDEVCEKCGRPMVIKWGRRGRFLSCSGFPACRNAKSITTGVKCPEEGCDGELIERKSRRGLFYGCTNYPKCTYTSRKLPETEEKDSSEEKPEEA